MNAHSFPGRGRVATSGLICAVALTLAACGGNPSAASKGNFARVINAYYSAPGRCVSIDLPRHTNDKYAQPYSQKVEDSFRNYGINAYLPALAKAGVFTAKHWKDTSRKWIDPNNHEGFVYTLTPLGQKAFSMSSYKSLFGATIKQPRLCAGHRTVHEITNFTKPATMMGRTVSVVRYTRTPSGIPAWAKAFGGSKQAPTALHPGTHKGKQALVLRNDGWAVASTSD